MVTASHGLSTSAVFSPTYKLPSVELQLSAEPVKQLLWRPGVVGPQLFLKVVPLRHVNPVETHLYHLWDFTCFEFIILNLFWIHVRDLKDSGS